MLTLKLISEETERVVKGLEKKHFPNAREAVEKVLEYDKIRREAQQKLDTNKQQANQFAKQIGALMKEGKKEEAESAKAQVAALKADGKALEEIMEKAQQDMTNELLEIPNIPCDEVPEGKDAADNVVGRILTLRNLVARDVRDFEQLVGHILLSLLHDFLQGLAVCLEGCYLSLSGFCFLFLAFFHQGSNLLGKLIGLLFVGV